MGVARVDDSPHLFVSGIGTQAVCAAVFAALHFDHTPELIVSGPGFQQPVIDGFKVCRRFDLSRGVVIERLDLAALRISDKSRSAEGVGIGVKVKVKFSFLVLEETDKPEVIIV